MSARRLTANGVAVLAASLIAVAADPSAAQSTADGVRPAAPVLSRAQARLRSARVADVTYDLDFRLSAELAEYAGNVTVRFDLSNARDDLTLDFQGGTVYSLVVNGETADGRYNDFYLTLPARLLRAGANSVEISFSRPYSDDGSGLYRFEDPEDGRYYLYTDFEPYNQNRLFPSFDQPDLKARYATRVTAPAGWHVITNVRESGVEAQGDDERTWTFPRTLPISTYVYALHAGEYHLWESSAGDIPLRLFARETLAPYVYPDHWFEPTRAGLEFYQRYFEVPYPFGKYDQIIVPHFNAGAMENVGAVTFTERYLSRGTVTRQNRRTITSVILHEMAHMWFGDLVTLEWWNGLWLNESFATVMSVIAMVEATEFTDEWQESFRDTVRAYRADERDTTHPIELPIADTDGAFANFDRITYEKGSAVLVQLSHLVGPETFRRGVGDYLEAHAYGNTSIDDFLGAISSAANIDLDQWADDWLLEPGTNTVEADLSCTDGRIESLALDQGAPAEWPTLRTHRAQLGLYYLDRQPVAIRTVPVTYSGAHTPVEAAAGLPCPDLVYANHGDWDFARVRLAPEALADLGADLSHFADPLARLMLWQSVWDLVLDARAPVTDYLEFALANLAAETDEGATRQVLAAMGSSLGYLTEMDVDTSTLATIRARVESFLWGHVTTSEPGSDRQLLFYDTYVGVVASDAGVERIASLLADPATAPTGIEIDQDRRWSLLQVLGEHAHPDFARSLRAERERDRSDTGRRRALSVEVGQPDADVKRRWIDTLLDPAAMTNLAEFRAVTGGLFPEGQHELQLANSERILASLTELSETREAAFLSSYVGGLLGPICSGRFLEQLERRIADASELHPIAMRSLEDSKFEVERCLRIAAVQAGAR